MKQQNYDTKQTKLNIIRELEKPRTIPSNWKHSRKYSSILTFFGSKTFLNWMMGKRQQ